MAKEKIRSFWKSKTKIGALIGGFGSILVTVGGWYGGAIEASSAVQALVLEVGAIFSIFGVANKLDRLNK